MGGNGGAPCQRVWRSTWGASAGSKGAKDAGGWRSSRWLQRIRGVRTTQQTAPPGQGQTDRSSRTSMRESRPRCDAAALPLPRRMPGPAQLRRIKQDPGTAACAYDPIRPRYSVASPVWTGLVSVHSISVHSLPLLLDCPPDFSLPRRLCLPSVLHLETETQATDPVPN